MRPFAFLLGSCFGLLSAASAAPALPIAAARSPASIAMETPAPGGESLIEDPPFAEGGPDKRGSRAFLAMETPWEMTGQAAGGLLGALAGGVIGGKIGADRARSSCLEKKDPDLSDECLWSGLGGGFLGLMIGLPVGHALGTGLVGVAQGKHGVLWAMGSAVIGDIFVPILVISLHNALDDRILPKGRFDPAFVGLAAAAMLAVPVGTMSVYDYHVRTLAPEVGLSPRGDLRMGLELAEIRF